MAATRKDPFLLALGERVRLLRARRGLTRKSVAIASGVSERHLANLEYGIGNASILVLEQVATALDCSLAELVGDLSTSSPEWLMLRELLRGRSDAELRRARLALANLFGLPGGDAARGRRIALIGLRGAGKSTLGGRLAAALDMPFIELSREVERIAGCSIREIHDLYGSAAYHRYERRALDETVRQYPAAGDRDTGRHRRRAGNVQRAARPLHDGLAAGFARGAHGARRRARRHPADGAKPRGDGGPAPDPRRPRCVLRQGRRPLRHLGQSEDESFEALLALVSGLLTDAAPGVAAKRRQPGGAHVKQTAAPV
jgi:Shikimate kinase